MPVLTPTPIIASVERALVDRLKRGLGRMVTGVESYGGEFDDENLFEVVQRFPAAWVTFAGVRRTAPVGTSREKWKAEGSFAVMVGTRSVRNEATARHGGPNLREIGSNVLIYCVRRLLTQQDLGLPIRALEPGSIRTLYNSRIQGQAFSVFALEFHTAWVEDALPLGTYPEAVDPPDLDAVFQLYQGQLDPPLPDWTGTQLNYFVNGSDETGAPQAQDTVPTQPATGAKP